MSYDTNKDYFDNLLQGGFDISKREIIVSNNKYYICFLNSLTNSPQIAELVKGLYQGVTLLDVFSMYCAYSVKENDRNKVTIAFYSGQCILLHNTDMYLIEVRNYPNQSSNEASNEQSIRGSHDGFVENIILNVGLLRRRLRNPSLRVVLKQFGKTTKTDIAYIYLEDKVNKKLLKQTEERLNTIHSLEIIYERTLCDALYGKSYNPYPSIRYCERPDICAIHLLQGYIVILVDNSFTSLIIPTTFFELTKQIEEYTQTSLIAICIRIIRLLAVVTSIYLLPIWLVIQTLEETTRLNIPILDHQNTMFLAFQVLLIEILIEWIRLSFIHTPQAISGVMGFLFIFLLGESAIKLNLYSEMILVLVVLSNVCNFVTPNYELSLANKLFRIILSLLSIFFSLSGFSIGILFMFFVLINTRNDSFGYLYPLIPFDLKEAKRLLLGTLKYYINK